MGYNGVWTEKLIFSRGEVIRHSSRWQQIFFKEFDENSHQKIDDFVSFFQIVINYYFLSISDNCGNIFEDYDEYAALTQDELCPEEKSQFKKAGEEKENFDKKTNRKKAERFKDTIKEGKKLEQENAIFWERVDRYLKPIQFCDINMPCTFRGQFAIKKPSDPKLEGNLYKEEIFDMKKSYSLPEIMSGTLQTILTKNFKTQFGDNFKNFTIAHMPYDFQNKQLQLVNFNVSFHNGFVKNVKKRKKTQSRRKKTISIVRKLELLNDRFKNKNHSKVIADETLEKKHDNIEPENEIKETVKILDKNDPEVKTGIVEMDELTKKHFNKNQIKDIKGPEKLKETNVNQSRVGN